MIFISHKGFGGRQIFYAEIRVCAFQGSLFTTFISPTKDLNLYFTNLPSSRNKELMSHFRVSK
jgi:hypothetical protein